MKKKKAYYIGSVKAVAKTKGWFFGWFMEPPLLRSRRVEIAWQRLPAASQKHSHRKSIEVNIVLTGRVSVTIDGKEHHLKRGDFFAVWPGVVVGRVSTARRAELLVIRAPSVRDKVIVR